MLSDFLGSGPHSDTERGLAERTLREELEREIQHVNDEHGKSYIEVGFV